MKKVVLLFIGFFLIQNLIYSQLSQAILTIGEYEFSDSEFWHIYNKNRNLPNFTETPEEFAERFLAYKLKVVEAISQGYDTLAAFKSEYDSYTKELKKSFLIDSTALEKVINEAAENMNWMVDASHILIVVDKNALPSDTLVAWEKVNKIKQEIEEGKPFAEAAVEYSQDPSVTRNKGRLGYFTAFQMVYPFEKAAFSAPVGKVSEITRSDFGYHIVWVHEKVKHPGEIRVAHIMKMFSQNMSDSEKENYKVEIDSIYEVIKKGEEFAMLARKHSGDMQSANNGGEMQPFSLNNMVPEFAKAAFALNKDGDVSQPVLTDFGWHIIKRLEVIPFKDPQTRFAEIKHLLGRDGRDKAGQKAYLRNCINSENFKLNEELKNKVFDAVSNTDSDTELLVNAFSKNQEEVIFSYRSEDFLLTDFLNWFGNRDKVVNYNLLKDKLDKYIELKVQDLEMRDLAKTNEQYRFLSNEYFDGLLIFDISEREIWSQVDKDSVALADFYSNNSELFMTTPELDGEVCLVKDAKLVSQISKKQTKDSNFDVFAFVASKDKKGKKSKFDSGTFDFVKNASNPVNPTDLPNTNIYYDSKGVIYWKGEVSSSVLIPMEKIKGEVISAYQKEKERLWIENLKEKHNPIFNYGLLSK